MNPDLSNINTDYGPGKDERMKTIPALLLLLEILARAAA